MATPDHIVSNLGPHLILLALLVLGGAGFFLYNRRKTKGGR
jgi:LPXTG-motif cell wall-anchored protein